MRELAKETYMAKTPDEIINRVLKASQILRQYGQVVRAYLFGSYIWGKFDRESDLDVSVLIEGL